MRRNKIPCSFCDRFGSLQLRTLLFVWLRLLGANPNPKLHGILIFQWGDLDLDYLAKDILKCLKDAASFQKKTKNKRPFSTGLLCVGPVLFLFFLKWFLPLLRNTVDFGKQLKFSRETETDINTCAKRA